MSASYEFETTCLQHYLQNTAHANIGDATGLLASGTTGNLYISLHTADPTDAGTQASSEATYTGYARIAVVRSSSGFDVVLGVGSNHASVTFAQCTGGSNVLTYFGVGTALTTAGHLLFSGALTSSLTVSNGITPSFAANQLTITAD
jgi:hypothetical protein